MIGAGELLDGRYRLESVIGAGGMGVVWVATHVARALVGGHALTPPVQHRDIKPGNVLVNPPSTAETALSLASGRAYRAPSGRLRTPTHRRGRVRPAHLAGDDARRAARLA